MSMLAPAHNLNYLEFGRFQLSLDPIVIGRQIKKGYLEIPAFAGIGANLTNQSAERSKIVIPEIHKFKILVQ
jgi:hypothetical protein